MRPFSAIGAAFLIACALPATSRADNQPASTGASAPAAAVAATPGCGCPRVVHRARHHFRHVRHWRYRRPAPVVAALPPPYNPLLPHPLDTAYDRGMVMHMRSAAVSGFQYAELGYPPTPPIAGYLPYRVPAYAGVYQYDGLTGQYVRLAQSDAVRSGLLPAPPPPPPPPPVRGERG